MVSAKTISTLRSLALFITTVTYAAWQKWTAADVAWSMWVASLIGGVTIMVMLGAAARHKPIPIPYNKSAAGALFILSGGVLFALIHIAITMFIFFGFHVAQAGILAELLPPNHIPVNPFEKPLAFQRALYATYWPFAIIVIIHTFFSHLKNWRDLTSSAPYFSIIKNHILIFILAVLQAFPTPAVLLYGLLFYYFFPVRETHALLKSSAAKLRKR